MREDDVAGYGAARAHPQHPRARTHNTRVRVLPEDAAAARVWAQDTSWCHDGLRMSLADEVLLGTEHLLEGFLAVWVADTNLIHRDAVSTARRAHSR